MMRLLHSHVYANVGGCHRTAGGVAASHNGCSDWPVLQPEERRQDLIPASESRDYGSTSRLLSLIRDICPQVCDGTNKT